MQNSYKFNWIELDTKDIVSKVTTDGVKYLELFLQDYTKAFNKKVNAGCGKCIAEYLKEYKQKYRIMENKSNFRLHKKREGIQLEFGSGIHVTNSNITDEYAMKLLKRYYTVHGESAVEILFDIYPDNIQFEATESQAETTTEDITEESDDTTLSLPKLREKYPSISARSKKEFLEKLANEA